MDFAANEAANGTRLSWNAWPSSKEVASKLVVPIGCLYTPLRPTENLQLVEYDPVICKGHDPVFKRECGAVLNPQSAVDFRSKGWTCPICNTRNSFPPHYAEHINEQNLPAELLPACSTIEYIIPQVVCGAPVFVFVLDIALIDEELEQARDSLQQSLALMPQNALVGFISFGAMVYVHELAATNIPHSYAFHGKKEYTSQQVAYQLGLAVQNDPRGGAGAAAAARFLVPVAQCEFALNSLLDDIARDVWPLGADRRPARAVGAALGVALGLLEVTSAQGSARIMMILGGPGNTGPGAVVGEELAETIRSHLDLQKGKANARYTKQAKTFYNSLATRAVAAGFPVDIFACSLDQVGLYEMKVVTDKSGGYMVMGDSFSMHVFKDSFRRVFDCDEAGYLRLGFNAKVEVFCSPEFRCSGAIGGLSSLEKKGACVAESETGTGGTCQWTVGSLDRNTTIGFYFDIAHQEARSQSRHAALQFQTAYLHPSGRKRLRVTTLAIKFADARQSDVAASFDQEAAAVLLARLAVWKTESQEPAEVVRWVDKMLLSLCTRFSNFRKDQPASFTLQPEFGQIPQFMYHLRRSNFLEIFNASPDETAYYRTVILRESTANALVMIQPALIQYSLDTEGPPTPVRLDSESLRPNIILLLDTFFHLVIWRGETIQAWYDAGYQEQEEYANFRALLQSPAEDAKQILAERFPVPKFIQTNAGGSQARFLTSKVNPSTTHRSGAPPGGDNAVVLTDDASLKDFMEHLIKLVVQS